MPPSLSGRARRPGRRVRAWAAAVCLAWGQAGAADRADLQRVETPLAGAMEAPGHHAMAAGVRSLPFPRLANLYLHGAVDEAVIPQLARWDLLVLSPVWTDAQLAQLRALHPDIKLFVYVCPYAVVRNPYSRNALEVDAHRYASEHDLWWYDTAGRPASDWPNTSMVNMTPGAPAGPEGAWRTWLVRRLAQHMETHPQLDGIFLDNFWKNLGWAQSWLRLDSDCNPTYNPGGCDSIPDAPAQLDAAWFSALSTFSRQLRDECARIGRRTGKRYALLSNSASDYFANLNGTMIEDFPRGSGRDAGNPYGYNWNRSMLEARVGYLDPLFAARPYQAGILNAGWSGTGSAPDRSPEFERHKRLTLASALLGDGFYSLDRSPRTHGEIWWEPEYDLAGSRPGYLGDARGGPFRVLEPTGPELVPNGGFELGVDNAWRFQVTGGTAQIAADASRTAATAPSARIDTQVASGPVVKLYASPIRVVAGETYTLRFWARASRGQELLVHLYADDCPSRRCLRDVRFWLGKRWKKYEYSFLAPADAGAGLNLFVSEPGSVWIDDVSLRAGDTGVYRRNFDRGIVLLNYTGREQTIPLESSYQRLHVAGHDLYDGTLVRQETLAPFDARILVRPGTVPSKTALAPAEAAARFRGALANPCRPGARVGFALARPGRVRLNVYDAAGRLVRTLVDADHAAGDHAPAWDGRDARGRAAASGTYFVELAAGEVRESAKLVLVR